MNWHVSKGEGGSTAVRKNWGMKGFFEYKRGYAGVLANDREEDGVHQMTFVYFHTRLQCDACMRSVIQVQEKMNR